MIPKTANLRNARFTKNKFINLKFNYRPEPERSTSEGYIKHYGKIRFAIIHDDPNNAYSSICTGYNKGFDGIVSEYDKKLHKKYKKYYKNKEYTNADVYKSYWDGNKILRVDFCDSIMDTTEINKINFIFGMFSNMYFNNCDFSNMEFNSTKIYTTTFTNCTFVKCEFRNIGFNNTKFINCIFTNLTFFDSYLYINVINSIFNKCIFQISMIPLNEYNIFNNCTFNDTEIIICRHTNGSILLDTHFIKHIKSNNTIIQNKE